MPEECPNRTEYSRGLLPSLYSQISCRGVGKSSFSGRILRKCKNGEGFTFESYYFWDENETMGIESFKSSYFYVFMKKWNLLLIKLRFYEIFIFLKIQPTQYLRWWVNLWLHFRSRILNFAREKTSSLMDIFLTHSMLVQQAMISLRNSANFHKWNFTHSLFIAFSHFASVWISLTLLWGETQGPDKVKKWYN